MSDEKNVPSDIAVPAMTYADEMKELLGLDSRDVEMPNPPWPDRDNPMLRYLLWKAQDVADEEGLKSAFIWLATHAWFEGGWDAKARLVSSS